MSAAGLSQGANSSPSGGSAAAEFANEAASAGVHQWCRRMVVAVISAAAIATTTLMAATLEPGTGAGWQAYRRGDYAEAFAAYEAASRKGDRLAQFNLAMMLLRGEGKPVDLAAGVEWL